MKQPIAVLALFLPWMALGQDVSDLSALPSPKPEQKLPAMDAPEPKPVLPESPSSPSIPQIRPPVEDPAKKSKSGDWAAQGVQERQEAAKKKQQEDVLQAEAKAREMSSQEQSKSAKKDTAGDPAISKTSTEGLIDPDKPMLPAVTGIDGVKPRASDSGDGRVQPSFDSFTGPSSSSPMGKDFQSGAKPIMPPSGAVDGRMMLPPKAPEPPSGAYKKVSEDPYALPAKNEPAKTAPPPKPKADVKNPPAGNPLTPGQPAGYSPYDNTRVVPDPRSTRKF